MSEGPFQSVTIYHLTKLTKVEAQNFQSLRKTNQVIDLKTQRNRQKLVNFGPLFFNIFYQDSRTRKVDSLPLGGRRGGFTVKLFWVRKGIKLFPRKKKNGDAPGPLGDFVMRLVTERTKKTKFKQRKKEKKNTKRKPLLFLQKMPT